MFFLKLLKLTANSMECSAKVYSRRIKTYARKINILLLILSLAFNPMAAVAGGSPDDENRALAATGNVLINALNKDKDEFGLKWVRGTFDAVDSGVSFSVKAFSVIKESEKQVFFTQYGLSKKDHKNTFSFGVGVNSLVHKHVIVGANLFYDATSGTQKLLNPFGSGIHKRYSVGGTIKTGLFEVYANIYRGMSKAIGNYKVLDGYDYGITGDLPGYEYFNLGVSKYKFSDKIQGHKVKIGYQRNSLISFGVEKDFRANGGKNSARVYAEVTYKIGEDFDDQILYKEKNWGNVWDKRYDEVQRENTLYLEKVNAAKNKVKASVRANLAAIPRGLSSIPVMLDKKPGAKEVLTVTVTTKSVSRTTTTTAAEPKVTITPSEIKFTSSNWNSPQLVKFNIPEGIKNLVFAVKLSSTDGWSTVDTINVKPYIKLTVSNPSPVAWGTDSIAPVVSGHNLAEMGAITYSGDTTATGGKLNTSTGVISGSTKPGTVTITATTAGGTKYGSVTKTFDVTFTKKARTITVSTPTSVAWGTDVDIALPDPVIGTGAISYELKSAGGTGATVIGTSGIVSGATQAGTVVVTVKRAGDIHYGAAEQDVNVVFTVKAATPSTFMFIGPASTPWGTVSNAPRVKGYVKTEMGAITYSGDTTATGGTLDTSRGYIVGGQKPGTVTITATTKGGTKYASVTKTFDITFTKMQGVIDGVGDETMPWNKAGSLAKLTYLGGYPRITAGFNTANAKYYRVDNILVKATQPGIFELIITLPETAMFLSASKKITFTFTD